MQFFISLLLASANCFTTAFNIEDVAVFLPLLRNVQTRVCPPNELWQTCTGYCSDCVQRRSCFVSECQSGCDCVPRYFRVEPNGPCVPVAQCPRPECGVNEVFRECGPVCERCSTLRCRLISCDHRCYCKEGHLRNEDGQCVPEAECPKRTACSHNEEWAESGPVDEHCLHEEGEEVGNQTQNVPGCYCKEGYRRNTFGSCVSSCLFVKCYGLAVYRKCVPKCNATCHSESECEEDGNCYPGCFCPKGHVMNEFNNCVPQEDCSTDIPEVKIVRGSGIMVEESETTSPAAESTTPGPTKQSGMDGSFEDGPRRQQEDVGQTESAVEANTKSAVEVSTKSAVEANTKSAIEANTKSAIEANTKSTVEVQTEVTHGHEDFANEDV